MAINLVKCSLAGYFIGACDRWPPTPLAPPGNFPPVSLTLPPLANIPLTPIKHSSVLSPRFAIMQQCILMDLGYFFKAGYPIFARYIKIGKTIVKLQYAYNKHASCLYSSLGHIHFSTSINKK